jgi:ABC-type transport system substrate-binding protein
MTRWFALALTAMVVAVLWSPAASAPAPAGTLRIGLESAPTTMDPGLSTDLYSTQVYSAVMEPLVMLDPQGVPRPALAEHGRRPDGKPGDQTRQNVKSTTARSSPPTTAYDRPHPQPETRSPAGNIS